MISQPEFSSTTAKQHFSEDPDEIDLSLEKVLRDKSKHGVFEADFENRNGTTVTVRDGDSVLLNCRVYLLHDKTVRMLKRFIITWANKRLTLLAYGDKLRFNHLFPIKMFFEV